MQNKIFSFDSAKAIKAIEFGYYNAIHYLAPHSLSGKTLCSHASPECIKHCLGWHSGQAAMVKNERDINKVRQSRIDKAQRFMSDRKGYLKDVIKSIENGIPVYTFWDIGVDDCTAIVFAQFIGREIRVLNYYEAVGQPLATHLEWLREQGVYAQQGRYSPAP